MVQAEAVQAFTQVAKNYEIACPGFVTCMSSKTELWTSVLWPFKTAHGVKSFKGPPGKGKCRAGHNSCSWALNVTVASISFTFSCISKSSHLELFQLARFDLFDKL